jgi:hypothetical protein
VSQVPCIVCSVLCFDYGSELHSACVTCSNELMEIILGRPSNPIFSCGAAFLKRGSILAPPAICEEREQQIQVLRHKKGYASSAAPVNVEAPASNGATCSGCGNFNEYQPASSKYVCFGCRSRA